MLVTGMLLLIQLASTPQMVESARMEELQEQVGQFWQLLEQRQKARALEMVAAESKDEFINRREPIFRSWKIDEIAPLSGDQYSVTVTAQQLVQGNFQDWKVVERWVLEDGGWRVVIVANNSAQKLFRGQNRLSPEPGQLDVLPNTLKIHFLSPTQKGSIHIRNGLSVAVSLQALDLDSDRFEIVEQSQVIPSQGTGRVIIRYVGTETAKNLHSQLQLVVKSQSEKQVFTVPLNYNVVSPGARALLGLTPGEAEKLKRNEKLVPEIKTVEKPLQQGTNNKIEGLRGRWFKEQ